MRSPRSIGPIGTFQSGNGTGASSPLTITYAPAINSVTITAQDPTFVGNVMTAYNGTVAIGSVRFANSGVPGLNVPSTRTLTGTITKIVLTPAPGDYVAYDGGFESAAVQVAVSCLPASVVRGATVTCTTTVTPAQVYVIRRRTAIGAGSAFHIVDTTRVNRLAGQVDTWSGPAIAASSVEVQVAVVMPSGDTVLVVNPTPATFAVTRRSLLQWSVVPFGQPGAGPWAFVVDSAQGFHPVPGRGARWGGFQMTFPTFTDVTAYPTLVAQTGPNKSLRTLLGSIAPLPYQPWVHAAVDRTAALERLAIDPRTLVWHDDQDGAPAGTCGPLQIALFRDAIVRHEGGTAATNSHAGKANQLFASLRPDTTFEQFFGANSDSTFRASLTAALNSFTDSLGPYKTGQRGFDAADAVNVYPHLRPVGACNLDNIQP